MRLIDADSVKRNAYRSSDFGHSMVVDVQDIDDAETVDAVPVVHGHWVQAKKEMSIGIINGKQCSVCKKISVGRPENGSNYCPDCGAKMDEEAEADEHN